MRLMFRVLLVIGFLFLLPVGNAGAENSAESKAPPEVNWIAGPKVVTMDKLATIDMQSGYLFLDKKDTVEMMKYFGNYKTGKEIGSIYPANEAEDWFIIFEYEESGHIKDDQKSTIDADDLLKSYVEGTKESNKQREKDGISPLDVVGWFQKPNYNEGLHSLVWGIQLKDDEDKWLNYEARLLSREGYVSATLVCDNSDIEAVKPQMKQVIDNFEFSAGKRYEDYVQGKDKLSNLGLAALIVGGAAAATKPGILIALLLLVKKFAIVFVIGIVAFVRKIFKKNKDDNTEMQNKQCSDREGFMEDTHTNYLSNGTNDFNSLEDTNTKIED